MDSNSKVYSVDNIKAKTLHVIRGHKYMFNINQLPNPSGKYDFELYFTESPIGGERKNNSKLLNTKSVKVGPVMLDIHSDIPDYFYYQDRKNKYMGGLILVHSPEEYKRLSNSED